MSLVPLFHDAPPAEQLLLTRQRRPAAQRVRRRAALLLAAAAAATGGSGCDADAFAVAPGIAVSGRVARKRVETAGSWCGNSAGAADQRRPHVARRLFDTGSFFGVGVPEAVIVGLLGWFLLGPEELFRLSKQFGNWLGELRGFVGQAAKQYETALDDESTRKAIAGIRETQKTVSEISQSWSAVANTFRDPLNISTTLNSTIAKYDEEDQKAADKMKKEDEANSEKKDKKSSEKSGDKKEEDKITSSYPDLAMDEPEPVIASPYSTSSSSSADGLDETPEELERKIAASKNAVKDLWYKPEADADDVQEPSDVQAYLSKLEYRIMELDDFASQCKSLKEDAVEDTKMLRKLLEKEQGKNKEENVNATAEKVES